MSYEICPKSPWEGLTPTQRYYAKLNDLDNRINQARKGLTLEGYPARKGAKIEDIVELEEKKRVIVKEENDRLEVINSYRTPSYNQPFEDKHLFTDNDDCYGDEW